MKIKFTDIDKEELDTLIQEFWDRRKHTAIALKELIKYLDIDIARKKAELISQG